MSIIFESLHRGLSVFALLLLPLHPRTGHEGACFIYCIEPDMYRGLGGGRSRYMSNAKLFQRMSRAPTRVSHVGPVPIMVRGIGIGFQGIETHPRQLGPGGRMCTPLLPVRVVRHPMNIKDRNNTQPNCPSFASFLVQCQNQNRNELFYDYIFRTNKHRTNRTLQVPGPAVTNRFKLDSDMMMITQARMMTRKPHGAEERRMGICC
jgi:hypothetical protein